MFWHNNVRNLFLEKHRQGFTLFEIIIAITISAILIGVCAIFFMMGFGLWDVGEIAVEMHQELREANMLMVDDLRQSGPVKISSADVPVDGLWHDNIITFKISNGVSASGQIIWSSNSIKYELNLLNNQLERTEGLNTIVVAEQIQKLQFRRQTPNIVEVYIQAAKQSMRANMNDEIDFSVKLRN